MKIEKTRKPLSNDTTASCSEGAVSLDINSLARVMHAGTYIRGTRMYTNLRILSFDEYDDPFPQKFPSKLSIHFESD